MAEEKRPLGKGRHPGGPPTQTLPPVEARVLVGEHICPAMERGRRVILVIPHGWYIASTKYSLCKDIHFCPWCGIELASLNS